MEMLVALRITMRNLRSSESLALHKPIGVKPQLCCPYYSRFIFIYIDFFSIWFIS